jgi:hypothetical protein
MRVEFLEEGAPDCPLIRIYGTNRKDFASFRRLIPDTTVAIGAGTSTAEMSDWIAVGNCTLELEVARQDFGVRRSSDPWRFYWMLTPQGWSTVAELVEPFLKDTTAGRNQWLDVGSISVLLSFSQEGSW